MRQETTMGTSEWLETQQQALPRRGDDVEQWLKRERDLCARDNEQWHCLDFMLEDYRLHADTGTPLSEEVRISHPVRLTGTGD